jgi:hypothetical protein
LRQRIGVYLFHSLISRRVLNSDIRQTEFSEGDMGRREFIALAGGGRSGRSLRMLNRRRCRQSACLARGRPMRAPI